MLHTTCRRFTKLRIFNTFDYKYRQNLVSKIANSDKSQTQQFRETAVSKRYYIKTYYQLLNLQKMNYNVLRRLIRILQFGNRPFS